MFLLLCFCDGTATTDAMSMYRGEVHFYIVHYVQSSVHFRSGVVRNKVSSVLTKS